MKTYTKQEANRLTAKVFSATTDKGTIQVKTILKKNALLAIQKFDQNFNDINAISELKNTFNSHQVSFDRVIEKYPGEFVIELIDF